jgi:hypothetical protein
MVVSEVAVICAAFMCFYEYESNRNVNNEMTFIVR